jgi:hypothetical protein
MGRLIELPIRSGGPATIEAPELIKRDKEQAEKDWIVTVYNNDVNTYEEVISILILATACSFDEAYLEAWEIDHLGRSVVHYGRETDCHKVAEIIGKIGIRVEVSRE